MRSIDFSITLTSKSLLSELHQESEKMPSMTQKIPKKGPKMPNQTYVSGKNLSFLT